MKVATRRHSDHRLARRLSVGLAMILVLALPAAALAQTTLGTVTTNSNGSFETTVTIPASTTPGTYDIAATGTAPASTPYPPSSAPSISVDRTVVRAGETVRVTGSGFSPNTTVTLRLEFVSSFTIAQFLPGPTQTVTARARIFVVAPGATIAPPIFRDIIRGVPVPVPVPVPVVVGGGVDRTGPIVVNNNNSSSSSSSAAAAAGGGGAVVSVPTTSTGVPTARTLARTGIETLPLIAASFASILLGAVCLSADRRRHLAAQISSH